MTSPHLSIMASLFAAYDKLAAAAFRQAQVQVKAVGSVVTQLDQEASALVIRELSRHTPTYGIISEEEGADHLPGATYRWVVDPVDGTASFARGYPVWGLGIGLMEGDEPREGYLHFPMVGESYAFDGEQLYFNGQPHTPGPGQWEADTRNLLIDSTLHRRVHDLLPFHDYKLREYGSTLYHLMCLAMGRAEGLIIGRCSLWDLAAALPITRRAGMVERHTDGTPFQLAALSPANRYRLPAPLVLGTPERVEELLQMLAEGELKTR